MKKVDFVDFATKAKELGISEARMRGRVLSAEETCFAYIANAFVTALPDADGPFLPAWDAENSPFAHWFDFGAAFDLNPDNIPAADLSPDVGVHPECLKLSRYLLSGWVQIPPCVYRRLLCNETVSLADQSVGLIFKENELKQAVLKVQSKMYCYRFDLTEEELDGGLAAPVLTSADLYFMTRAINSASSEKEIDPRREANLLRIIESMRSLLMAPDGGGFPSQAKVIDQLVARFGTSGGVSKRNLEDIFAAAKLVDD